MSVLAGTSILRGFLGHMSGDAQESWAKVERGAITPDDLRHELDAYVAVALAAYGELGVWTREAAPATAKSDAETLSSLRDAHRAFVDACQPVLRLLGRARGLGATPRREDAFMSALGEAQVIANRYDRVVEAEGQADRGETRRMEDVRDELRRRVHASRG